MEFYRIFTFKELGDERGNLVAIEGNTDIPFDIKRVFYMYGTDNSMVRGKHANRDSNFILINVSGSSKIKIDDGQGHDVIVSLNQPRFGVFIPKMVWKEMFDFSSDSVILCLSDHHYDSNEYIRDYDEYVKEVNQEN